MLVAMVQAGTKMVTSTPYQVTIMNRLILNLVGVSGNSFTVHQNPAEFG